MVASVHALYATLHLSRLHSAWYDKYNRSSFHFFNDNAEWLQVDKSGHVWSAYQLSRASAQTWRLTGLKNSRSAVLGATAAVAYLGIVEIQDAYSSKWGFSWADMGSNLGGAALFVGQELLWKQQKFQVKLSYNPVRYPRELKQRADQLFGTSLPEKILKDYNAQTYWLSANISSFIPDSRLPSWLNVAVGYGGEGLYGARSNVWTTVEGANFDYSHIERIRNYYLAPDIDLTRIKTRSRFLRSVFFLVNAIKVPTPAVALNSKGKFELKLVQF